MGSSGEGGGYARQTLREDLSHALWISASQTRHFHVDRDRCSLQGKIL
jgi:hypothetical protein